MSSIEAHRFSGAEAGAWNSFIPRARNGHFIFDRRYMDYHNDRFDDFSLMFHKNEQLVALLPANKVGNTVVSHGGLTFGGFLIGDDVRAATMLDVFKNAIDFLGKKACRSLLYKRVPYIYHRQPADEDLYALSRLNGRLVGREITSALDLERHVSVSRGRKATVRKARREGASIDVSTKFGTFMSILGRRLDEKYGTTPTHTTAELEFLANRFPDNIKLFAAELDSEMVAGAVVYQSEHVAHTQYLATTEIGRKVRALDAIIAELAEVYRGVVRYLDLGTSSENDGREINESLMRYKEAFGARAVVHDQYLLEID